MEEVFLRPCPFCGGRAGLFKGYEYLEVMHAENYLEVKCTTCGAQTRRFFDEDDESAREMWDRRTDVPEAYIVTDEIPNCTIHVLKDPKTGAESWGWRRNEVEA